MTTLTGIRIVLVETSHPGNIGAAARAMKTMGLSDLALVAPKTFPSAEATARSAGAEDILYHATVHQTLQEALTDCTTVVGTSARLRSIPIPIDVPRGSAEWIASRPDEGRVAIVFGRERTGLTNDELDHCQRLVNIPTNEDYHSLNLAAAVQVICHELRTAILNPAVAAEIESPPAPQQDVEHYFGRLESALVESGFLNADIQGSAMRRLRRLYGRAQPDEKELAILQGILTSLTRYNNQPK